MDQNTKGEKSKRILIVDDDQVMVKLLVYILTKNGFIVETSKDGREALHKELQELPDLIILDIVMPNIDGFQLAKILKSNEKTKNIKILLCSSKNTFEDIKKGIRVGADDYITKPFNPEEILQRINVLLLKENDRE